MVYHLFAHQLKSLYNLLQNLEDVHYRMQSPLLANASIGQHVRHTIELAQALLTGYQIGEVNYDKRKRDIQIETDTLLAQSVLTDIICEINLSDKELQLILTDNNTGNETKIATNYFRELAYNTEHTIHHMALIKVALREMQLEIVDEQFGVAPSTLKHRQTINQ